MWISGYLIGLAITFLMVYDYLKKHKFIRLTKIVLSIVIPVLWPIFLVIFILLIIFLAIKAALS